MIRLDIDVSSIARQFGELKQEVEAELMQGVGQLASMIHARIAEEAHEKLHSSLDTYMRALSGEVEQVAPGVYMIGLEESAFWIEEGLPSGFDMKPGLLRHAKMFPNGKRYNIIPMRYNKSPSNMTGYAKKVSSSIQKELRKRGLSYKNVERDRDGNPKKGQLHEFDFGGGIPGKGNTPVMKGVNIYQDVAGGNVRRDVLTFRTVTDDKDGKWKHPGLEPKRFFDSAARWGMQEWETSILPEIMRKWEG
jgi:hypothetical protein